VYVSLTGPRRRRIAAQLEIVEPTRTFAPLIAAADWVYNSGRDVEARHTLFVYELAREWPDDMPFSIGFAERATDALEAAKTAFRTHVRDASKETLKSLQELRKALADDVARVVTQTRELSGIMWRDLLVVVAAVLGRFTLFSTPGPTEARFADGLLLGLALYLLFSIAMTVFSNARFMSIFRDTQEQWKTKLYGFVDPKDFTTLATVPLGRAESVYRCTRNAAIVAYGLTIICLLALAILPSSPPTGNHTGGNASALPPPPQKNSPPTVSPLESKRPQLTPKSNASDNSTASKTKP
jgi:hypothetical protein